MVTAVPDRAPPSRYTLRAAEVLPADEAPWLISDGTFAPSPAQPRGRGRATTGRERARKGTERATGRHGRLLGGLDERENDDADWSTRQTWNELRPGAPSTGVTVYRQVSHEMREGALVTVGVRGRHAWPEPLRSRILVVPVGPAADAPIAVPGPGWQYISAAVSERFSVAAVQGRVQVLALLFDAAGHLRFRREQPAELGQGMRVGVTDAGTAYALVQASDHEQRLLGFTARGRALPPRSVRFEDDVRAGDVVVFTCGDTTWLAAVAHGPGEERVFVTSVSEDGELLPPSLLWAYPAAAPVRRQLAREQPASFCTDGYPVLVFAVSDISWDRKFDAARIEWE